MLEGCRFTPEQINQAACDIAKQVLGQDIVSERTFFFAVHGFRMLCKCCQRFILPEASENDACRETFPKVAKENGTLVAGGITQTKAYTYQEVVPEYLQNHSTSPIFCFYDIFVSILERRKI